MGSYTGSMGLYLPDIAETGWGDEVNNNFTVLDSHYVDVGEKYDITTGSTSATVRENNQDGLNAAISDNIDNDGRMLLLPPGVIEIAGDSVGYAATADMSARLTVRGWGRGQTIIRQMTPDTPTMRWGIDTTVDGNGDYVYTGNFRTLRLSGFQLRGMTSTGDDTPNLQLDKVGYCVFDDIVIWQGSGIKTTRQCFDLIFQNCWVYNSVGYSLDVGTGGAVTLSDCTFGEDAAAFVVSGASLYVNNCEIRQAANKVAADGYGDYGPEMFQVTATSTVVVQNSRLSFGESGHAVIMCALDRPRAIRFVGNDITAHAYAEEVFATNRILGANTLEFKQNYVRLPSTSLSPAAVKFVNRHATNYQLSGMVVAGNQFSIGTNRDMTVDDQCLTERNRFLANTYYRGTQA